MFRLAPICAITLHTNQTFPKMDFSYIRHPIIHCFIMVFDYVFFGTKYLFFKKIHSDCVCVFCIVKFFSMY